MFVSPITNPFGTCEPVYWQVVNFSLDLNAKYRMLTNSKVYMYMAKGAPMATWWRDLFSSAHLPGGGVGWGGGEGCSASTLVGYAVYWCGVRQ